MRTLAPLAVLALAAPAIAQQPPMLVQVQGRLLNGEDLPVTGTATLKFRFYPSDGSTAQSLWTGTYTMDVREGIYSVNLGDQVDNALPASMLQQGELWMSVQVNGDAEMNPRLRVGSTIWALRAGNAATLDGHARTEFAYAADVAALSGANFTGPVTLAGAPTADLHAATRKYVDDKVAAATPVGYALLSGAAFSGPVTLAADPTADLQAATKSYVDDVKSYADGVKSYADATFAPLANPVFSGLVTLSGPPQNTNDAANKGYVDGLRTYSDATFAKLSGAAFTGTVTVPAPGSGTSEAATKGYVDTKAAAVPVYDDAKAAIAAGGNLVTHWQMENSNGWQDVAETTVEVLPDGREARAHRSIEGSDTGACYNWAITNKFAIDPNKAYEFSLWIRSTEADMDNYFGFYAYDANGAQITGSWNNPYFKTGENDPSTWRLWRAYMLPSYVTDSTPNDGVADKQSLETNGVEWRWPPNAVTAAIRFGSCYGNGSSSGNTFYLYPSAREVNALPPAPQEVFWHAYNGAATAFNNGQTAAYNTVTVNVGGAYNTSTGVATVPYPGVYELCAYTITRNDTAGDVYLDLFVNGANKQAEGGRVYGWNRSASGDHINLGGCHIRALAAGDTVQWVSQSLGVYPSGSYSWMTGARLSR